MQGFLD